MGWYIHKDINSLHPRITYSKVGLNLPSGSGEEDQSGFAILLLSPFWKGCGPSFVWTSIPSPMDAWCQGFEIGFVVLVKKIIKHHQCIFAILILSPLGKGHPPSFEQTWNSFTQEVSVPNVNGIRKVSRQTARQIDHRQKVIS